MAEDDNNAQSFGKTLRVFVSYANKDKLLAGALKKCLERFGLDVFLAHEDIMPTLEWQKKTLSKIKQTNVLIALLTNNFRDADYTAQEIGVAIALQKLIISLKADVDPYGFINKYQAFKFTYDESKDSDGITSYDCTKSCAEIIKVLSYYKEHAYPLKGSLIRALSSSGNFRNSNEIAELLDKFKGWAPAQLSMLMRSGIENRQVYEAHDCKQLFRKLFGEYEGYIDLSLRDELLGLIGEA